MGEVAPIASATSAAKPGTLLVLAPTPRGVAVADTAEAMVAAEAMAAAEEEEARKHGWSLLSVPEVDIS